MRKTLVISDLHLGVQRTGGTTTVSADALRRYGHSKHRELLALAGDGEDIVVNGDLSDTFNIDLGQAIEIYAAAAEWLNANPTGRVFWALGNHDLSKDSSKLGTVAFIGKLLQGQFPSRFKLIDEPGYVPNSGIYVIPHVANQDLFDLELTRVPDEAKVVLLHCNYDNTFACQADHSLNLSRDQAKTLVKAGKTVVLGHEHQGRTVLSDKVIIVGNQFPTSVSDCLRHGDAQADGCKYALVIEAGGEDMELVPTWSPKDATGGYREIDWRRLDTAPVNLGFIRVVGEAEAAEAAEVIKAIANLRQSHDAFVITNAVKVDAVDSVDEVEASIEEIKAVSVIDLLLTMLDDEQQAVVRNLMKDEQQ